ncbi:hypothetical protein ON010_g4040 [Phytophthora cinnamomi]|nr:hypothetical protein ON010_g4040 [Phytophthora cinnamomi]
MDHFNQRNQPSRQRDRQTDEWTHLAKLSNTRSNLGDEQNSAARVMMDDAIAARGTAAMQGSRATARHLTRPFVGDGYALWLLPHSRPPTARRRAGPLKAFFSQCTAVAAHESDDWWRRPVWSTREEPRPFNCGRPP